ncbi:hypothetical protein ACFX13_018945 [Malus domestica]
MANIFVCINSSSTVCNSNTTSLLQMLCVVPTAMLKHIAFSDDWWKGNDSCLSAHSSAEKRLLTCRCAVLDETLVGDSEPLSVL